MYMYMYNVHVCYVVPMCTAGMLYIRRRNQLLQDNAKHTKDSSIREHYLKQRSVILARKYGSLKQ